ncbi:MAG: YcxB family protein [Flavobacteriales bacterium]|nr:YcxB family protein [Flavobacteriales bacterium]
MISTNPITLNSKEFFQILITVYFRKRWWFLSLLLLLAVFYLFTSINLGSFRYFFITFSVVYPLLIIYQYWAFANSSKNKIFFLEKHYDIDTETLTGHVADGTQSTIKISHFVNVVTLKHCYLLYLSKSQFTYIPFASFKTPEDRIWFEEEVVGQLKRSNE